MVDPKCLKLTPMDDEIYNKFREDFKSLDVKLINEDELKNKENKEVSYIHISDKNNAYIGHSI